MLYTRQSHPILYNKWLSIKQRCYNPNEWIKRPTYQGCTVHDDWLNSFQKFAEDYTSMIGYGLPNRQIDKDILYPGNKIYSRDTCVLVPEQINTLLTHVKSNKGLYPTGVYHNPKNSPSYMAHIRIKNVFTYLGSYHSPEEAYNAYKIAKENNIKEMAELYKHELDPRVYNVLMIIILIINGNKNHSHLHVYYLRIVLSYYIMLLKSIQL